MLVMMQRNATPQEIQAVCDAIQVLGFNPLPMPGALRTAIGVAGDDGQVDTSHFEGMAGVASVLYDSKPYKQVSRDWQPREITGVDRSWRGIRRHRSAGCRRSVQRGG